MKVNATGGPYTKPGVNAHEGTVYIVAGTSGRLGSLLPQAPYPAMYSSRTEAGSLVMDVNGDQMVLRFLTETGAVVDTVTLKKGVVTPPTTLISAGSSWRYLDDGSNQGTAWRANSFNDNSWRLGDAQLGYGDGDEQTVVSFGPNSKKKYITTYFRRAISVANPSTFTTLNLSMIRDDGAVVYINGVEVWRSNMPTGTVNYKTQAVSTVDGANGSTWFSTTLNPSALVSGNNVIAVEIHQDAATSSDISFDLKLSAQ
jgi:hypothetical protein